jgi:hypothetical protein
MGQIPRHKPEKIRGTRTSTQQISGQIPGQIWFINQRKNPLEIRDSIRDIIGTRSATHFAIKPEAKSGTEQGRNPEQKPEKPRKHAGKTHDKTSDTPWNKLGEHEKHNPVQYLRQNYGQNH